MTGPEVQAETVARLKAVRTLRRAARMIERELPGIYVSAPAYVSEIEGVVRELRQSARVLNEEPIE